MTLLAATILFIGLTHFLRPPEAFQGVTGHSARNIRAARNSWLTNPAACWIGGQGGRDDEKMRQTAQNLPLQSSGDYLAAQVGTGVEPCMPHKRRVRRFVI